MWFRNNPDRECKKVDKTFLEYVGVENRIFSMKSTFRKALTFADFQSSARQPDDLTDEDWDAFLLSLGEKIDAVHAKVRQTPEQVDIPEQMNTRITGDVVPLMDQLKQAWEIMKSGSISTDDVEDLLKHILKVHPTISRKLLAKIWKRGLNPSNLIEINEVIFMPAGKIFMLSPQDFTTFYLGDIEGNWHHRDSPSFGRVWFGDIRWDDRSRENRAPPMFMSNNLILRDERSCQKAIKTRCELSVSHPNSFSQELEKTQPMTEETSSSLWNTLTYEEEYQHFIDQRHQKKYYGLHPNSHPNVHAILSPRETFLTQHYLQLFPKASESQSMYCALKTLASTIDELSGRLHSLITLLRDKIDNGKFDEAYTLFLYRAAEFEIGRQQLNIDIQKNSGDIHLSPIIAHSLAGKQILDNFGEGGCLSAEAITEACQQPTAHPVIHAYYGLLAARDRLLLSMDEREQLLQSAPLA